MASDRNKIPAYLRAARAIEAVLLWACGVVFAAMTFVTLLGVFFRYVVGDALSWTEEMTRFLLIFIGLFGAALALHRNEHVGFTMIVIRLPKSVASVLSVLSSLAILCFAAVMIWEGFRLAVTSGTWAQILPVPMIIPLMIVPLSGCFIALFTIVKLLNMRRAKR